MQPQYLIIGQGIAGTLLSYALWKQGKSILVIDQPRGVAKASWVAGAVINPVNVNRWKIVSRQEEYISTAVQTYQSLEKLLVVSLIEETSMLVFHADQAKQQLFKEQQLLCQAYMHQPSQQDVILAGGYFNMQYGIGKIQPVWSVNAARLLSGWSDFLKSHNLLLQQRLYLNDCHITPESVVYNNIQAEKIIFCEGAAAINNAYFNKLPFTHNRGEALLLSVPDLPATCIYHYGIRLVPTADGLFWCGSNYQWLYKNLIPDLNWRRETETTLRHWLKFPFEVVDHIVAERPTTAGQEFLMGMHPAMPSVGIFNGLGTRGFSCGPALANAFSEQLTNAGKNVISTYASPLHKWI